MISSPQLRLYVAGDAPNSAQALRNLRTFAAHYFDPPYHIEIIDVLKHPDRALKDRIFLTPTLVRTSPAPQRRIVGSLSELDILCSALGVERSLA